jgi:hypothetical protein
MISNGAKMGYYYPSIDPFCDSSTAVDYMNIKFIYNKGIRFEDGGILYMESECISSTHRTDEKAFWIKSRKHTINKEYV